MAMSIRQRVNAAGRSANPFSAGWRTRVIGVSRGGYPISDGANCVDNSERPRGICRFDDPVQCTWAPICMPCHRIPSIDLNQFLVLMVRLRMCMHSNKGTSSMDLQALQSLSSIDLTVVPG